MLRWAPAGRTYLSQDTLVRGRLGPTSLQVCPDTTLTLNVFVLSHLLQTAGRPRISERPLGTTPPQHRRETEAQNGAEGLNPPLKAVPRSYF